MGTKRPHEDGVHPSRRANVQSSQTRPFKRPRLDASREASSEVNTKSVNALKGKIRDLARLLERSERLPADVRIEKERALTGYKSELEKLDEEKRRKDIIGKYHMVRFFGKFSPQQISR